MIKIGIENTYYYYKGLMKNKFSYPPKIWLGKYVLLLEEVKQYKTQKQNENKRRTTCKV